jgi:hypothetical protein
MYEPVRTTYFVGASFHTTTVGGAGAGTAGIRYRFWERFELGGSAAIADTNPSAHSIPKAALFVAFIPQFPTIPGQRKLAPVLV